ncbi:MAG TPA: fibronectin type III domain-containing protein [Terrimicrobiaceae bacterium]
MDGGTLQGTQKWSCCQQKSKKILWEIHSQGQEFVARRLFSVCHIHASSARAAAEPRLKMNFEHFPFWTTAACARRPHAPSWSTLLAAVASLLVASLLLGRAAQSVTLAWDANPLPNIAGYKLYYSTAKGKRIESLDVGNATTATISNLDDETTYFITVAAYDTAALESQASNEISFKTAPLGAHTLTVNNGTGSGKYTESTRLKVSATPPGPGQQFDRWTGDCQILDNPFESTTTALMLFRDLAITARYRASGTFANESYSGIDAAALDSMH